jgi:branched-chain amino acid transport system permease protein
VSGVIRDASRTARLRGIAETEIAPLLLDEHRRSELIEEHRRNPIGSAGRIGERAFAHSAELVTVLDFFRRAPVDGKLILIAEPDRSGWRIGRIGPRGVAPTIVSETVHPTRDDAEHAAFLRRVAEFVEAWSARSRRSS